MLGATTACNSSSLIWPDGSAPAALASLLVDPPEPRIIGKTQWVNRDFPTFSCTFLSSSLSFSSLVFSLLLFFALTLLPCAFPSVHIVGNVCNYNYIPLHYATWTTLQYTTRHYTTLHSTTLQVTTLHSITPQHTTRHKVQPLVKLQPAS